MAGTNLIVFVAESHTAQARLAALLPDGNTVCSLTWHADGSDFSQAPDLVLVQNKDRCVNRALIFVQGLATAAPVYVYGHKFTDFRRDDLQRRGATGVLSLDSPREVLQARLADLLPSPPLQEEVGRRRKTLKRIGLLRAAEPEPHAPVPAGLVPPAGEPVPIRRAIWSRKRRSAA